LEECDDLDKSSVGNDEISSVIIEPYTKVTFWQDVGFGGARLEIAAGAERYRIEDLNTETLVVPETGFPWYFTSRPGDWNDFISSLKVEYYIDPLVFQRNTLKDNINRIRTEAVAANSTAYVATEAVVRSINDLRLANILLSLSDRLDVAVNATRAALVVISTRLEVYISEEPPKG